MSAFWDKQKGDARAGWQTLGVARPSFGLETAARFHENLVNYMPVKIEWNKRTYEVGIDLGMNSAGLEAGGFMPAGSITLHCPLSQFDEGTPEPKDEIILIRANGEQLFYQVSTVTPVIEGADPAFTMMAEPIGDEDNE